MVHFLLTHGLLDTVEDVTWLYSAFVRFFRYCLGKGTVLHTDGAMKFNRNFYAELEAQYTIRKPLAAGRHRETQP